MCFLSRMGQLISRLFKRLSSSSSSNDNSGPSSSSKNTDKQATTSQAHSDIATDSQDSCPKQKVQSIPVGQSIDSAEYTALAHANNRDRQPTTTDLTTTTTGEQADGEQDKRVGVEEAVIKIQALIRGHLTRKALKDVNQFSSLGQSQFDHDTLMSSEPASVFELPGNAQPTLPSPQVSCKPVLESIAEQPGSDQAPACGARPVSPSMRKLKLQEQARSNSSPSKLEMPSSPGLSESGASIDLGGTPLLSSTPASASVSIDISDHNIRPTERMASVLHHKTSSNDQTNQQDQQHDSPKVIEFEDDDDEDCARTTTNGGQQVTPPDCREQAAIRIQSAFRGYKTRKSSPYRKRSPSGSQPNGGQAAASSLANGFGTPEPDAAANGDVDNQDGCFGTLDAAEALAARSMDDANMAAVSSRRPSRTRERSPPFDLTASSQQQQPSEPTSLDDEDDDVLLMEPKSLTATQVDAQSLGSTDVLTVISNTLAGQQQLQQPQASQQEPAQDQEEDQLLQQQESSRQVESGFGDGNDDTSDPEMPDMPDSLNKQAAQASWNAADSLATEAVDYATSNVDELTAALETVPTSINETTTTTAGQQVFSGYLSSNSTGGAALTSGSDTKAAAMSANIDIGAARRQSDLSQDLITDSSLLGAALSFNEGSQREDTLNLADDELPVTASAEERDFMADIEAEAERLVGELDSSISALDELGKETNAQEEDQNEESKTVQVDEGSAEPEVVAEDVIESTTVEQVQGAAKEEEKAHSRGSSSSSNSKHSSSGKAKEEETKEQENDEVDDEAVEHREQQKLQQMQNPKRTKSRNRNKRKGGKK